jgi:sporulation protein YlmC with PRC-barrel domain
LIGPEWIDQLNKEDQTQSHDGVDYVRHEVALALKRGIVVIPVLIDGATMPSGKDLPDDIKLLAERHACGLRDADWDYYNNKLVNYIFAHTGGRWRYYRMRALNMSIDIARMLFFLRVTPSGTIMLVVALSALGALVFWYRWSPPDDGKTAALPSPPAPSVTKHVEDIVDQSIFDINGQEIARIDNLAIDVTSGFVVKAFVIILGQSDSWLMKIVGFGADEKIVEISLRKLQLVREEGKYLRR